MTAEYAHLRVKMVDGQLRTTGITDARILSAMGSIPREAFLPAIRRPLAYLDEDIDIPTASGHPRYLMEPAPFAKLVQLAVIGPADRVLDVGCGTGYSSAVLSQLAGSVDGLECEAGLAESARVTLAKLGFGNVAVFEGALEGGYPQNAPYDVIVVGGAVDEVPEALFGQLDEGGRLVAVIGEGNAGIARICVKVGGVVSCRRDFNAAIRPLPGFRRAPAFEF
jgi:protein-L-isoaspartate(D-aspartate) O-methyltransferase